MPGFNRDSTGVTDQNVLFADNVDFSGSTAPAPKVIADGQLLIGSTATPNIRVNTLSSPDGSIQITNGPGSIALQVTQNFPYYSLTPYIVGTDIHSKYPTIQAAITDAILDGASAANPANIYVKPTGNPYVENITLADGINIMGLSNTGLTDFVTGISSSVFLDGSVTLASGTASVQGIAFVRASGNIFEFQGGNLNVVNCTGSITSGILFNLTTASTKNLISGGNNFLGDTSSQFVVSDTSAATIVITDSKSTFSFRGTKSVLGANGLCSFGLGYTNLIASLLVNATTFNGGCIGCSWVDNTTDALLETSASTTGQFTCQFTTFSIGQSSTAGFIFGNAAMKPGFITCDFEGSTPESFTYQANAQKLPIFSTNVIDGNQRYRAAVTGWDGSDLISKQAITITSSSSPATILTIAVASGEAVVFRSTIIGSNAAHNDITGGDIIAVADGTAAALIGVPVTNVMATSTGSFTATFSGGNLVIQVIAPSATTYNWSMMYSYHKVLTSS